MLISSSSLDMPNCLAYSLNCSCPASESVVSFMSPQSSLFHSNLLLSCLPIVSDKERSRGDHEVWTCQGNTVGVLDEGFETKFAYDHVFPAMVANQEVYETVASSIVQSALDGINGTIFAYGVTSSGKTYTMMGSDDQCGVVPLAITEVYNLIGTLSKKKEFALRLSMLEIYNEVVNDLLSPGNNNLRLREDPRRGVVVEGAVEERLRSSDHALAVIAEGNHNRKTSATAFNEGSSRSHTIIRLSIEANERAEFSSGSEGPDNRVVRTLSYLTMVDLAGSESARAELTRDHRVEGSYINKSLLTLGTVIHKLSEGGAAHIPFRDSKLTRLLSNSLAGNGARVSVICTITPASTQAEETHNTLKFASRAKKITIEAKRNEILDQSSLIARYQQELSMLKHQLEVVMREKGTGAPDPVHPEIRTLMEKYEEEHAMVIDLEHEKESLKKRVEALEQCRLDMHVALAAADERLKNGPNALSQEDVAEECHALRRQVIALVEELRDRERTIRSLSTAGGADLIEEDVAIDVMLAEREYMVLQIKGLEDENYRLLHGLDELRKMYAEAKSIDPTSIKLSSMNGENGASELQEDDVYTDSNGIATTTALARGTNADLRDKVLKMEERLTAFYAALKRKNETISRQAEVQKTLTGLQDEVKTQLAEVTSENRKLKQEIERLEVRNQRLQGLDVDGMDQFDLLKLISELTEAVHRVRISVKLKQLQFRDNQDAKESLSMQSVLTQRNGKMSTEELGKAIMNLKQYRALRATQTPVEVEDDGSD